MAITLCPRIDDEHAAFPHRLVINSSRSINRILIAKTEDEIWEADNVIVYVICANCDHWIGRIVQQCGCVWRCHDQGISEKTVTAA